MKKLFKVWALTCGFTVLCGSLAWSADPKVKSRKEAEAFTAMQKEMQAATSPDAQLKAIDGFLDKYADTEFKVILLQNAMQIAQQKRDTALTMTYAERLLEADPKNFEGAVTIASETANGMKEFDLDKAEKTAKVQKYAQLAIDSSKDYPKPVSQIPDDQWALQKKEAFSQAHVSLGMSAMANKKYDDAITEYKAALDVAPNAIAEFRLGEALMKANKFDDANTAFDKVLTMPDANATVKQYAQQRKADVAKLKAAASK
jgi:tetratricopeptide (TPR) repeat protein